MSARLGLADMDTLLGYADLAWSGWQSVGSVLAEWGMAGVEALREQASVLVIVDVLSFSTAVDVAVSRGAAVFPFSYGDKAAAQAAADHVGAALAQALVVGLPHAISHPRAGVFGDKSSPAKSS